MVIVDDHLALLAIAGRLADLREAFGPVVTTYAFHFRLARALGDSARIGALSRRVADPTAALRRVLRPPAHRLIVLDSRASMPEAVDVALHHRANLLLAELVGAARHHSAAVRVTPANEGRAWASVMDAEQLDYATIEP